MPLMNLESRMKIELCAVQIKIHEIICGSATAINDFFRPILSVALKTKIIIFTQMSSNSDVCLPNQSAKFLR